MTITRSNGTMRNAIRNSAMPASTKTCAGLDPKRAVSDRGGGDIVVREDTGPDDNRRIGSRKPLDLWWPSPRRHGFLRLRFRLSIILHHGGIPSAFEFRLPAGCFLAGLELLE